MNPKVSDPNDHKIVSFHNSTDFGFTPEMGCMFDGRSINGKNGSPGIDAGETVMLPYHIGHRLATNLAKVAMTKIAPLTDAAGIPTGVPLWDSPKLENLKNSYLTDLYTEEKPIAQSETDKLMAKVEQLKGMVDSLIKDKAVPAENPVKIEVVPTQPPVDNDHVAPGAEQFRAPNGVVYQDKQEVIAELEKRQIAHDKRQSKATLEKLLS